MKKRVLTIALLLVMFTAFTQSNPANKTPPDTPKPTVPVYAIVLDSLERNEMLRIFGEADEKPSTVRMWINYLLSKSTLLNTAPANVPPQPLKSGDKAKNSIQ